MVALAGCTLHANRQPTPPPAPTAEVVKPAPDPPLSIPQTSASLNTPREWNAAAIPIDQTPDTPAPKKVEVSAPTHPPRAAVQQAKQLETSGTTDAPDPAATQEPEQPAAAAPAASETAPFQPIMSAEQQNQLKTNIATRKRDIQSLLKAGEHADNDKTLVDRIKSSLNLADEAEKRGDYTQADALLQRALVLAQELKVE